VGANREKGVSVCVDYRTDCFTNGLIEKIWVIEGAGLRLRRILGNGNGLWTVLRLMYYIVPNG